MTRGDDRTVKCPHCRKPVGVAAYVTEPVRQGETREFQRPCPQCGREVYYWLRWAVVCEAERADRVK